VVFPDADAVDSRTAAPFGVGLGLSGDHDPELGMAGARAHNRWLADFCAAAPGRRAGVFQILLNDVEEAVKEIRRAATTGLKGGLMLPGTPPNSGLPELHARVYDPIWAVCAELGVPVNHHAGSASRRSATNRPPARSSWSRRPGSRTGRCGTWSSAAPSAATRT
jgi:predicted TIM-barrel fold metal-dependent hydrolase